MFTIWLAVAMAEGPRPDLVVEWIEPTCGAEAVRDTVRRRVKAVCDGGAPTSVTWQVEEVTGAGCRVWAHAWCPVAARPTWQPPGGAAVPTLFNDAGFKGLALALDEGTHDLSSVPQRETGDWNRKAGSLRVPEGYSVRLCADGDLDRCTDATADVPDLGAVYVGNDRARIVTVTRGALAGVRVPCPRGFEHDNFGGKAVELCADLADLRSSPWNDMMSSVIVPSGWAIEVCDGVGGVPPCVELGADTRKLGDTPVGADRVSSVRVVRRP